MKYEEPRIDIILSQNIILTSYLDVDEVGGNGEEEEIVMPRIQ